MAGRRITNPLSSSPRHKRRKGSSVLLWIVCSISFVVVMIYFVATSGSSSSSEGVTQEMIQQQQQTRVRGGSADLKSKRIIDTSITNGKTSAALDDDAMASQSHDLEDDDTVKGIKVNTEGITATDDKTDDGTDDQTAIRHHAAGTDEEEEEDDNATAISLSTIAGDIHIDLRPDLSLPSVEYIQKLLQSSAPCTTCRFYRADKPGILQGELAKKNVKDVPTLGECPPAFQGLTKDKADCPAWDTNCGCHGPIMTRGMVGWA
eukprot:CAMPEP_0198252258 /NCGR_PEP_ID=MMETSP1447-20131203/2787_1 /TAXON_ID=420782 /ORGANISM="Chaetoceros dichaeta, Strain CCMP1751" /LENGTH=261 /DNA_ID=CAMNT_0043937441 /DNA_START=27 /DNA_END=808 /DNA_ORIENTATION=-